MENQTKNRISLQSKGRNSSNILEETNFEDVESQSEQIPLEPSAAPKSPKVSFDLPPNDTSPPQFEELHFDHAAVSSVSRLFSRARSSTHNFISEPRTKRVLQWIGLVVLILGYNAYFIYAIVYNLQNGLDMECCNGLGLLIILTALTYISLLYFYLLKPLVSKCLPAPISPSSPPSPPESSSTPQKLLKWILKLNVFLLIFGLIAIFIVVYKTNQPRRIISGSGIIIIVLIGLLCSKHPERVNWRQVFGGIAAQLCLGLFALRWMEEDCFWSGLPQSFGYLADGSLTISSSTYVPLTGQILKFHPVLLFGPLSVIYFFAFFVGVLYHMGIMSWIMVKLGWAFQTVIGTLAAESINAAANIFLGQPKLHS
ncbi:Sodium/nucleoside cotransporter 1 [Orchesella cincta]|uniref:Sodium/nucleoside cotransporter 1 n=1 Tax=Orchesella cincta TaxID=48709 RepID=A0A1D2MLZ8_ORCCI|nr:Sodium/nucleoside cotransporter 1 [Orchesella cincta]